MSSLPNWRHWKGRLSASISGAATSCTRTSKCAPQQQVNNQYTSMLLIHAITDT